MTQLVKLNKDTHGDLRVNIDSTINYASKAHVMSIRATEVGKIVTSLPVFITKNQHNGHWALSAITSVQPGHNLFVENNQWTASYQPTCMQTHPFYLMDDPDKENSYTVGFDPNSPDFTSTTGEALFESDNKASAYLSRVTSLLEADIKNDIQSYQFLEVISGLGLIKSVDLVIRYQDGSENTIQGLHTINEEKLQLLSAEQLLELNQKGYLNPIHAMLISILQINALVKKNNEIESLKKVGQVKLETSKNSTAF